jgi:phage shock protein PspC (stress-responsive transcriptional regulator)
MKRLYRSESDRKIAGICGGLAEYFEIDPVIIRVLFVALALGVGSGVLLYIIMWFIIPTESEIKPTTHGTDTKK